MIAFAGDLEAAGMIPLWLSESDPRPAAEQLNEHYAHGGGWVPFDGFDLIDGSALRYPDDPDHMPLAMGKLRDEKIMVYHFGWVAILQKDGSFEVARMD